MHTLYGLDVQRKRKIVHKLSARSWVRYKLTRMISIRPTINIKIMTTNFHQIQRMLTESEINFPMSSGTPSPWAWCCGVGGAGGVSTGGGDSDRVRPSVLLSVDSQKSKSSPWKTLNILKSTAKADLEHTSPQNETISLPPTDPSPNKNCLAVKRLIDNECRRDLRRMQGCRSCFRKHF